MPSLLMSWTRDPLFGPNLGSLTGTEPQPRNTPPRNFLNDQNLKSKLQLIETAVDDRSVFISHTHTHISFNKKALRQKDGQSLPQEARVYVHEKYHLTLHLCGWCGTVEDRFLLTVRDYTPMTASF